MSDHYISSLGGNESEEPSAENNAEKTEQNEAMIPPRLQWMKITAPVYASEVSKGSFAGEPTSIEKAISVVEQEPEEGYSSAKIVSSLNPESYNQSMKNELVESIRVDKPGVVCISNTSESHWSALSIAKEVKKISPETVVILGGAHEDGTNYAAMERSGKYDATIIDKVKSQMTLFDEEARNVIDIVVSGDGQYALRRIAEIFEDHPDVPKEQLMKILLEHRDEFKNVEGSGDIFVLDSATDKVETIPLSGKPLDWNETPFMNRDQLIQWPGVFDDKLVAQVMTQYSCSHRCSFCMESMTCDLYGTPKPPSLDTVINEIQSVQSAGAEAIFFDDSTFTQNPKRTEQLMEKIINLNKTEQKLEWGCQTTFADIPNRALLEKMSEAGCSYVYFGFEQLFPEGEKVSSRAKEVKLGKVREVLSWCQELEIRTGLSLQFGLEGASDWQEIIDAVANLDSDNLIARESVAINIRTVYPGTLDWLELMKEGRQNEIPDYSQPPTGTLHPRLETSGRGVLSPEIVSEIYAYAVEKLGNRVRGVEHSAQEVRGRVAHYQDVFSKDFYFSDEKHDQYLEGAEGLDLNPASISSPREILKMVADEYKLISQLEPEAKEKLYSKARFEAGLMVGVGAESVLMGRNTTEVTKLIAWLCGLSKGDRVVMTNAENESIPRAFELNMDHGNPDGQDKWSAYPTFYSKRGKQYGEVVKDLTGVIVETVAVVGKDVQKVKDDLVKSITRDTKCLVVSHVVRDTGMVLPIREICEAIRQRKKEISPDDGDIVIIVDGAQALGNLPEVDFQELGCDAYVAAPHKTMDSTPVGLGFMNWDNPTFQENLPKFNKLYWQDQQVILRGMFDPALGIESNVNDEIDMGDIKGFKLAVDHLKEQGYFNGDFSSIAEKRQMAKNHFGEMVHNIGQELGVDIQETSGDSSFIYSFAAQGLDGRRLAQALSERGIFVSYIDRTPVADNEQTGVIRASFNTNITSIQIDKHSEAIAEAFREVEEEAVASFGGYPFL
ncbi:aminotransferase class V-fold PLP-dependent enzyme [Patescibacteria group bacterium]|nr:aminotransferase class V-fold PLP-dependent enzyme [Patescibacteria group bacterium]